MSKESGSKRPPSSGVWEELESYARAHAQWLILGLLEEDVEELLGRRTSERPAGDGSGLADRVRGGTGPLALERDDRTEAAAGPGVGRTVRARSRPLFKRRTQEVGALLPQLDLPGLAEGDFELALRGLLGEGAPLSGFSIGRLKAQWQLEYQTWRRRTGTAEGTSRRLPEAKSYRQCRGLG